MNGARPVRPAPHRTLLRPRLPPDLLFHGALILALALLEAFARTTAGDPEDALGVAVLLLLGSLVRRRHARRPLPWVKALAGLADRFGSALKRESTTLGIDLQRTPPVPPGFPPLLERGLAALVLAAVGMAALPALDAVAVRDAVRAVSGLAWLLLLGGSWILFAVGAFYLLFVTFALTHDEMVRAHEAPGPRPRGRERLALCGWVAVLVGGGMLLPAWTPLAVHGACLLASFLVLGLPGGPDVPLLWKDRRADSVCSATTWRTHALAGTGLLALLLADATLLLHARGGAASVLPLTAAASSLFAWSGAAALLCWCQVALPIAIRARRSAAVPPPADRTGEIRARRDLVRGLEFLFKRAAGRTFRRGSGFWVAPWHWFCLGLSRDEDERAAGGEGTFFLETIGPAYHRVFAPSTLAHAREVMGGLGVDLVFVEDGVGFRRFRRVLRMAFEVRDMLGPRGRAEERHFTGLPGVRVVLHDFTMEEPFRRTRGGYPEPDYDTVGRARILHVFRDRGEEDVTADAPRDRRGAPVHS